MNDEVNSVFVELWKIFTVVSYDMISRLYYDFIVDTSRVLENRITRSISKYQKFILFSCTKKKKMTIVRECETISVNINLTGVNIEIYFENDKFFR